MIINYATFPIKRTVLSMSGLGEQKIVIFVVPLPLWTADGAFVGQLFRCACAFRGVFASRGLL
jgi:hypothetical protein